MFFKKKKVKEVVKKKKSWLFDFAIYLVGATIYSLVFNLFLLPNNIVVGFSGLSVIVNDLWGIKPFIFLLISYIALGILCLIFLGFGTTKRAFVGALIYPFLVEATSYLVPYINLGNIEKIVEVMCGAIIGGFGSGLIYKVNYSTGGTDMINSIVSKYFKKPIGTCHIIANFVIIGLGFLTFGLSTVIYSIIVVCVMSLIIDKIMIGISQSKTFQIITSNETDVKKFLLSKLSHGVTVLDGHGGYTGNVLKIIMCVVPTGEYVTVKEGVLELDSQAVILVSDVYEVIGSK